MTFSKTIKTGAFWTAAALTSSVFGTAAAQEVEPTLNSMTEVQHVRADQNIIDMQADDNNVWALGRGSTGDRTVIRYKPIDTTNPDWKYLDDADRYSENYLDMAISGGAWNYLVTDTGGLQGCLALDPSGRPLTPDLMINTGNCVLLSFKPKVRKVTADPKNLWVLTDDNDLYRRPLNPNATNAASGVWQEFEQLPQKWLDVSVSRDSGWVYGLNTDLDVWSCEKPCSANGSGMRKINRPDVKSFQQPDQIYAGFRLLYLLGSGNSLHVRPLDGTGPWTEVLTQLDSITSTRKGHVWGSKSFRTYKGQVENKLVDKLGATGSDVAEVSYKDGHYVQKSYKFWEHLVPVTYNSGRYHDGEFVKSESQWLETERTADVVKLTRDDLSGHAVTLDLKSRQVLQFPPRANATPLRFSLLSAWPNALIVNTPPARATWDAKGADVSDVQYGDSDMYVFERRFQGRVSEYEPKKWVHNYRPPNSPKGPMSSREYYDETGRDENSVYLKSDSGKRAMINLWKREVTTGSGTSAKRLGDIVWAGNQEVLRPLTPEESAYINQQEKEANITHLTPPVSDADLNKIMVWIAGELSDIAPEYCYRETYGRTAGYTNNQTCMTKHGSDGNCQRQGALYYPTCNTGKMGVGPVCWDVCSQDVQNTGRHLTVECGVGCAYDNDVCAKSTSDMVFGPINFALNAASFGLNQYIAKGSGAGSALGGALGASVAQTTLASYSDDLYVAMRTANALIESGTHAADSVQAVINSVDGLDVLIRRYSAEFDENFASSTDAFIDRTINQKFPKGQGERRNGRDASYIKQKYAQYHMTNMMAADGWEIADLIGQWAFTDPSGFTSAVLAYVKPVCDFQPEPFPDVTILPKSQRGPVDKTTRSHSDL